VNCPKCKKAFEWFIGHEGIEEGEETNCPQCRTLLVAEDIECRITGTITVV